jgi:hypothetical protein
MMTREPRHTPIAVTTIQVRSCIATFYAYAKARLSKETMRREDEKEGEARAGKVIKRLRLSGDANRFGPPHPLPSCKGSRT